MPVLVIQPDSTAGVDTEWDSNTPTNNYGIRNDFHVGYTGSSALQWKSAIKFDLSSFNSKAIVNSAILSLYCYNRSANNSTTVEAHRALTQWFEGNQTGAGLGGGVDGSTWNLRNNNGSVAWGAVGAQSGTDYSASVTGSVAVQTLNQWYDINVKSDVQGFIDGTYTNNYGWILVASGYVSNNRKFFYSSDETTNSTLIPMLTINYNLIDAYDKVLSGVGRGVMRGAR